MLLEVHTCVYIYIYTVIHTFQNSDMSNDKTTYKCTTRITLFLLSDITYHKGQKHVSILFPGRISLWKSEVSVSQKSPITSSLTCVL